MIPENSILSGDSGIQWHNIFLFFIMFGLPLILIFVYYLKIRFDTVKAWKEFAQKFGLTYYDQGEQVAGWYNGHFMNLHMYNPFYDYEKEGLARIWEAQMKNEAQNMNWTRISITLTIPWQGEMALCLRRGYHSVKAKFSRTVAQLNDSQFDATFYTTCSDPYLPQFAIQPVTRGKIFQYKHWYFYCRKGKVHAQYPGRFRKPDQMAEILQIIYEISVGIESYQQRSMVPRQ